MQIRWGWLWLLAACDAETGAAGGPGASAPPAPVEVVVAASGDLDEDWRTLGDVVALERAELAAGATGPVVAVRVREGDRVAAGAILVEVDLGLAEADLAAARALQAEGSESLAQAQRDLQRFEGVREGVLAQSELDGARSRVAALQARQDGLTASARRAAVLRERHLVRAPFPGLVTGRHIDVGDWVQPGQPAIDLVSAAAVEVRIAAPAELVDRLAIGDAVVLLGPSEHNATVAAVVPVLDAATRTALVRVSPQGDAPAWLVPGAAVEARFALRLADVGAGAILVSRDALVLGPAGSRVVKVVDGLAQGVAVAVLATTGDQALVRAEGLAAGDVIVVRGNERLRDGQAVVATPGGAP